MVVPTSIPLPNITFKILAKVIEYCKCHFEAVADGTCRQLPIG
ncbi:hypothetical protein CDL15_Pgr011996 [Olea europaea subsp. europaea]|uniref:SKP1 component POZ domain-containing protein n=1 Tax=Olea europaea subsp. europaea TaxID=158383 RepID=A0A8S0S9W5_OLEEU|nr:hypothetical protein CDL15_Pgr011996 [Olea europaea subsp. europaea]